MIKLVQEEMHLVKSRLSFLKGVFYIPKKKEIKH